MHDHCYSRRYHPERGSNGFEQCDAPPERGCLRSPRRTRAGSISSSHGDDAGGGKFDPCADPRSHARTGPGLPSEKAPMRGIGLKASVLPAGSRVATTDVLNVSLNNVSLEHFQNIGMRLLKGRGFVPQDDNGKPRPAIVSKSFSRKFFPNVEPIGQAVGNGGVNEVTQAKYQIVGIVNDSKYRSMREIPPPTLIVRDAAWTVLPGILCGFALYAACARVLVPLLYGVTQWKAISFVGAVALVIAVTVLASEWSLWHQAGSTNGCRRILRSVLHRPEWRRIQ